MNDPVAYTYDADTHCPDCAEERFGRSTDGFIAEDSEDSEGNPVGVIAPWEDEDWYVHGMACGTCGCEISEAHPWVLIENTPGYLPDADPAYFSSFDDALEAVREQAVECAWTLYEPEDESWETDEDAKRCISETVQMPASDEFGNRDTSAFVHITVQAYPHDSSSHDLGRVLTVEYSDA